MVSQSYKMLVNFLLEAVVWLSPVQHFRITHEICIGSSETLLQMCLELVNKAS